MKRLFRTMLIIAATSILATGCTETFDEGGNAPQNPEVEKVTISAIANTAETRISMGDKTNGHYPFIWNASDEIFYAEVVDGDSNLHYTPEDVDSEGNPVHKSGDPTLENNDKLATFSLSKTKGETSTFYVYYPFNAVSDFYYDTNTGNVAYINIPQTQTLKAGEKIDPSALLLYATAESSDDESPVYLDFKNLTSYIRLSLVGLADNYNAPDSSDTIEKVQFIVKQGHYLSGQYYHYFDGDGQNTPEDPEQTCYSDVVVDITDWNQSSSDVFDIWFSCMPCLHDDGFNDYAIRVTTSSGKVYRRAFNGKTNIKPTRGEIVWLKINLDRAELMESGDGDFVQVTSLSDIEDGLYVIAAYYNNEYYAMQATSTSGKLKANQKIVNSGKITVADAKDHIWKIAKNEDGTYSIKTTMDAVLGYGTSGTNFATTNPKWKITNNGNTFRISNTSNSSRLVVFDQNNIQFGAYSTSNNTGYTFDLVLYKQTVAGIFANDDTINLPNITSGTLYYSVSGNIGDVEVSDYDGNVQDAKVLNNGEVYYELSPNFAYEPVTSTIELATADRKYVTRVSIVQPASTPLAVSPSGDYKLPYGIDEGSILVTSPEFDWYVISSNGNVVIPVDYDSADNPCAANADATELQFLTDYADDHDDDLMLGILTFVRVGDNPRNGVQVRIWEYAAGNIEAPKNVEVSESAANKFTAQWDIIPGVSYEWKIVSENNPEATGIISDKIDNPATGEYVVLALTEQELSNKLQVGQTYYLYVRSITSTENSAWSEAVEFRVDPAKEPIYKKITSIADLESGEYLIVYETGNVAFDGSLGTLDTTNNGKSVTISNGYIKWSADIAKSSFTYDKIANTLMSASGFYIGRDAASNGLTANKTTKYTNTISFDNNGNVVITGKGGCTMRYNMAKDQNRFRYYTSGQQAVQLYKKVVE